MQFPLQTQRLGQVLQRSKHWSVQVCRGAAGTAGSALCTRVVSANVIAAAEDTMQLL